MSQKYAFVAAQASSYPVTVLCRVVGLARSGYYAWQRRPPAARVQRDQQLTQQISAIFGVSRQTYGSPRVHADLRAQGVHGGRTRVARLMRQTHVRARRRRRTVRTTDSCHDDPIAPNLLQRTFTVQAPNRVGLADSTYLPTREGWLYLAVVLDLYARRVVGWSMQETLERRLVLRALQHALGRRQPPPGLLHHSDRGSQYASTDYQALLHRFHMHASMSGRGNCWDNAPMESFFATLKTELAMPVFASHAAARQAVFEYIERFPNRQRRHSALAYLSPDEYEQQWNDRPMAA